jgi:AcrR family transcriptional regulator
MPAKKTKLPTISLKDRVIDAALELSSRMGWDMVTMTDIAEKAGASLAELSDHFDDKTDILIAYGKRIDKKMLEAFAEPDPAAPSRDRLFDILMERFDIIGADRAAVVSILKSFTGDPKQAVISFPHLGRSMAWTLEAAGVETSGLKGAVRVMGLAGVYLYALKAWMDDDSPDLSKTMAALDKGLSRAEQCANTFML